MRRILFIMLLISLSGCGRTQPPMAGSKWAESLRGPDVSLRKKAAFTLGNIGPNDPAVLPALIGALKDADPGVRREAILALLKLGPGAREAIPALTELRHDPDPHVRDCAAKALGRLEMDADSFR